MGDHEYHGGCSVSWGKIFCYLSTSTVLNTPMVLMISPLMYHDIPMVLSIQRMVSPTALNTPTVLMVSPTCVMIFLTVLSIPHGTEDNPHGTHDIPHGTDDIPHGTAHSHGTVHMLYRVVCEQTLHPLEDRHNFFILFVVNRSCNDFEFVIIKLVTSFTSFSVPFCRSKSIFINSVKRGAV